MTAEEVRRLLRDGTVDPFDLIAREGSSLRRELIEVDEVFEPNMSRSEGALKPDSTPDMGSKDAEKARLGARVPDVDRGSPPQEVAGYASADANESLESSRSTANLRVGMGPMILAGQRKEPEMIVDSDEGSEPSYRRHNPKHYYLIDSQEAVQGPLAATDVLRLYYKGVLDSGVVVVRGKSGKRIPVERFVAMLARRPSGHGSPLQAPGRGNHPKMRLPVTGQQAQIRIPRIGEVSVTWLTIMLMVLGLFFGAAAAWLVMGRDGIPNSRSKDRSLSSTRDGRAKGKLSRQGGAREQTNSGAGKGSGASKGRLASTQPKRSGDQGSGARPGKGGNFKNLPEKPSSQTQEAGQAKKNSPARKSESAKVASDSGDRQSKKSSNRAGEALSSKAKRSSKNRSEPDAERLSSRRERTRFNPPSPLPSPPPVSRPNRLTAFSRPPSPAPVSFSPPAPPPLPPPPPRPSGGGGGASLSDGQTVTAVGPFTFDRAAVNNCQAACSIPFRGPMGTITAKFFKSVWGPILLGKSGPVRISGLVKKSGSDIKIIISDIQ